MKTRLGSRPSDPWPDVDTTHVSLFSRRNAKKKKKKCFPQDEFTDGL